MNKTFRSIWNARKQTYVAVAEHVAAHGKSCASVKVATAAVGVLMSVGATAQTAPPPSALPTGAQLSAGQASVSQSGAHMVIQQSSDRAAINWQTFNVGQDAQVQFQQPNAASVILNRVMGSDPSQIFGRISANGQVILTNPAGVYFGRSARVDVGGLIASAHSISDADFMAGNNHFERSGSTGSVVNEGEIQAALGGYIALLAPEVRNQGAVIAQMGTVAMASGEAIDLHFDSDNRLTSLRVDPSQVQALIDNQHAVQAPGGLIIISAMAMDRLAGGVIKNSGALEANSLTAKGGRIVLEADHIALQSGSRIDATGATGGGTVLVGGDWQGSGDMHRATTVTMAQGASIDASATDQGDGGKVVLWSDVANAESKTSVHGSIVANGGSNGGDGGQVETSGHLLDIAGVHGEVAAPQGQNGQWLLDPGHITIGGAESGTSFDENSVSDPYSYTAGVNSVIAETDLEALLNNGVNVTISTGTGGPYHIYFSENASIDKVSGGDATLSLIASGGIFSSGASHHYSITSTAGRLNVVLVANGESDFGLHPGYISTNGGGVWVGGGTTLNTDWIPYAGAAAIKVGDAYAGGSKSNNWDAIPIVGDIDTRIFNSGSPTATGGNVTMVAKSACSADVDCTDISPWLANHSITSASGNITLTQNELAYNTDNMVLTLSSTGVIAIQPFDGSFSQTVTWAGSTSEGVFTGSNSFANLKINGVAGVSGLAIGKSSSTSNSDVVINSVISIAGSISIYGTSITLNESLTSTASGASILVQASSNILTGNTAKTVSTNNGNVSLIADSDANGSGSLDLDYTTYSAGTGNILVRGETFNWGSTNLPTFSATTGSLTIEPSDDSFGQGVDAGWFNFPTTLAGFTLGKSGNTAALAVNTNALSVDGPIKIYGSSVYLSAGLTTTDATTGDILIETSGLSGSGDMSLASGRTLTITQTGNAHYDGVISGAGVSLVKGGAGDLSLSGAHTYGGNTTVDGGVLSLGAADRLPDTTVLTVNANGTFNLNGYDETVASISGSGVITTNTAVIQDGLVLWLDAGNAASYSGTGTTWYDLSGNGYDATIYGAPTYDASTGLFTFTDNSQYAQIGTLPADFLGSTVNGITVFTVANFGADTEYWETLVDLGSGSPDNNILMTRYLGEPTRLNWEIYTDTNQSNDHKTGYNTAITNGVKGSYVGTADGSNFKVYRDGVLSGTTASTVLPNPVERNSNYIGKSNWAANSVTFRGGIGTVMVYDRALTEAEIARNHQVLFNSGTATLTTGGNNGDATFTGTIDNGSGTLNLVKAGDGVLTLSGANTYAGTTSISGGSLVIQSDTPTTASSSFGGVGTLVIQPSADDFSSGFSTTGWTFDASLSGLTIGKSATSADGANDASVTIGATSSIAGPISVYGGAIHVTADMASSAQGAKILLKGSGYVVSEANVDYTTVGGDIILWANSGNATTGDKNNEVALRGANVLSTSGGKIVLAGGLDTNADGVPDGYAYRGYNDSIRGVDLGASVSLDSAGGNITIRGQATGAGVGFTGAGVSINSGTGTVAIHGLSAALTGVYASSGSVTIRSANTTADAISVTGTSSSGGYGIEFASNAYIYATGIGGGIALTGAAGSGDYALVMRAASEILAKSGPIQLLGTAGDTGSGKWFTNGAAYLGSKSGSSDVGTSSSDITIGFDYYEWASPTSGKPQFATTGDVTLRSASTSFGQTVQTSWFDWNQNSQTMASFTFGRDANASNLGIDSAITAAGPITVYGGSIAVNAPLTAAENILLDANHSGTFLTQNTKGVTIGATISTTTASNGNITIKGRGGSGTGYENTDGVYITNRVEAGGTGNITITGYGGLASNGGGGSDHGISLDTNAALVKSNGGNIVLTGYGGGAGSGSYSQGISSVNGTVSASGSGTITISGTGGVNAAAGLRGVVLVSGSNVYTAGGAITITGLAGTNGLDNSDGVTIDTSTVGSASSGSITLIGTAGGGTGSEAIALNSATLGASSYAGDVILRGNNFSLASSTISTVGALTLESYGDDFTAAVSTANLSLASTVTGLTIGKRTTGADGTSDQGVTIGSATSIAGSISIYGGNITINAGLTASGTNTITLQASGNVTDGASGYVSADKLALKGAGNFVLDNASNAVGTLAAGDDDASAIGSLTYVDSNALTIGTVNPSGITATGAVTITASVLTIDQAIDAGSDNITLIADAFTIAANVASSGALVIKPKTTGTTLGIGTGAGAISLDPTELAYLQDGFSSVTLGGSNTGNVTVKAFTGWLDPLVIQAGNTGANLTVDGDLSWSQADALTLKAANNIYINGDLSASHDNAALNIYFGGTNGSTAPSSGKTYELNLVNHNTIDMSGATPSLSIGNQSYSWVTSMTDLASMTASGHYALKTSLTAPATAYSGAVYTSIFTGSFDGLGHTIDDLKVSGSSGNIGLFATAQNATFRHLGLTNADIRSTLGGHVFMGALVGQVIDDNLTSSTQLTRIEGAWSTGVVKSEVNQTSDSGYVLMAGGLVGGFKGRGTLDMSRVYSTATVSAAGAFPTKLAMGGLIGDISFDQTSDTSQRFHMDRAWASGSVVSGEHGGYYGTGGLIGVLYTGTLANASVSNVFSWGSATSKSAVSVGGLYGFMQKGSVTDAYTVQAAYSSGSNAGGNNSGGTETSVYANVADTSGTTLLSGFDTAFWSKQDGGKPYLNSLPVAPTAIYVDVSDATVTYGTVTPSYTLVNKAGTAISLGSGAYANLSSPTGTAIYSLAANSNVGTYADVSYLSGLTLGGSAAGNFILYPYSTAARIVVSRRTVTLTASKVYDGFTALGANQVTIGNLVGTETLNYTGAKANDAHVATSGKYITSITLTNGSNGGLASNYVLPSLNATNAAVTITPASLSATASITAVAKTYDGLLAATGSTISGDLIGELNGDSITLDTSGLSLAFSDAHVATPNKTIAATGNVALGTFTAGGVGTKNGSAGNAVAGQLTDYQFTEQPTISAVAGTINAKTLAVTAPTISGSSKVYDGLLAASSSSLSAGTVTGFVGSDSGSLNTSGITLAYDSAHVTSATTISASGSVSLNFTGALTGSGDGSSGNAVAGLSTDYGFSAPSISSISGGITAAPLSASASITAVAKTYDGLLAATGSTVSGDLSGELNGDSITLDTSGLSLAFSDAHVATANKTITATGNAALGTLTAGGVGSKDGTAGNAVAGQLGDYQITTQPTINAVSGTINAKTLAVTAPTISGSSKVYDGLLAASSSSLSAGGVTGFVGSDSGSLNTSGIALAYDSAHVTSATTISASGSVSLNLTGLITGTGNGSSGNEVAGQGTDYAFSAPTVSSISGSITAAPLSASASITAVAKTYDGTLAATGSSVTGDLTGEVGTDVFTLDTSGLTLSYSDAHVVGSKTIGATGNVALGTLSSAGSGNKDGSSASNLVVSLSSDYALAAQPTIGAVAGSILAVTLTPTLSNVGVTKVYDGTASGPTDFTPTYTFSGLLAGDTAAALSNTGAAYDSKDVASASKLTVSGLSITGISGSLGSAASDYVLDASSKEVLASITRKTVTLVANKSYDGTTALTGAQLNIGTGVTVGGVTEALNYSGASTNDAHVATADKYLDAITLVDGDNGEWAGNYQLPDLTVAASGVNTVSITAATLTTSLSNTNVSKVYDGTTSGSAAMTPSWSISGWATGDTAASLTYDSSTYNSKDVATASKITVAGLAIERISGSLGSEASDYVLDASSKEVAATIERASLTVTAMDDAKFVTQADPTFSVRYSGFVNGENSSTASGFSAPTVTRTGGDTVASSTPYADVLVPAGAAADNYQLSYVNGDFTIVPSDQLLVRVTDVSDTYGTATQYALTSVAYYNGSAVVRLDDGSVSGSSAQVNSSNLVAINDGSSGTASFTLAPQSAVISTAAKLAVGSYQLGFTGTVTENSANFSDTITVVGAHTVTPKTLTVAATGASKVYDGTTSASGVSLNAAGLESGDVVTFNGDGHFSTKNAGTALSYAITGLTRSGADRDNYVLASTSTSGSDGVITKRALTLSYVASNKTYDGNASAVVVSSDDRVAGDDLSIAQTATFADKNVGEAKVVSISSIALSGSDWGNYALASTSAQAQADITRLSSVTWIGGATGNWFDPANWAGGAVPDLSNVANVVIPTGVVVSFDTTGAVSPADASQAVNIESLGTAGSLTQNSGTLNVGAGGIQLNQLTVDGGALTSAGTTQLNGYAQSSGSFSGTGDFTSQTFAQTGGTMALQGDLAVTQDFSQGSAGQVSVGGNTQITDLQGGVVLGNLTTTGTTTVTSRDGAITQASGTSLQAAGDATFTAKSAGSPTTTYDIALDNAGNDFQGTVNADGNNITLNDGVGGLTLGDISAEGDLEARSTDGAIDQAADTTITVKGDTTLAAEKNGAAADIALDGAGNDFQGTVNADGNHITLNDGVGGLTLGDISAEGDLNASSTDGAIDQAANTTITVKGDATLAAEKNGAAADIALDGSGNDFQGTVNADGNHITLNDGVGSLTLGDINAEGDLLVASAGDLTFGPTTVGGDLSARSGGNVAQTAALVVQGGSQISAPSGQVTLTNPANQFIRGISVTALRSDIAGDTQTLVAAAAGKVLAGLPRPSGMNVTVSVSSPTLPLSFGVSSAASEGVAVDAEQAVANGAGARFRLLDAVSPSNVLMMAVSLPAGTATTGTGFSFALPQDVREWVGKAADASATLADGAPLPASLRFDAETLRFEAQAVPAGGFPLQVAITAGGRKVLLTISERGE